MSTNFSLTGAFRAHFLFTKGGIRLTIGTDH